MSNICEFGYIRHPGAAYCDQPICQCKIKDIMASQPTMDASKCDCNPLPMEGMHDRKCAGWQR